MKTTTVRSIIQKKKKKKKNIKSSKTYFRKLNMYSKAKCILKLLFIAVILLKIDERGRSFPEDFARCGKQSYRVESKRMCTSHFIYEVLCRKCQNKLSERKSEILTYFDTIQQI